mmetsp:Transcript_21745/g.35218  ORF Transcript_21745/g.35218 Transcript_21745/m.35218 type:complete len:117 (-) Transcript_21745:843-1193(-)
MDGPAADDPDYAQYWKSVKGLTKKCHLVGCSKVPATGRFKECGRCRHARYCSELCQRNDWPDHRHLCESLRVSREEIIAELEQSGSGKSASSNMKRDYKAVMKLFAEYPPGSRLQN